MGLLMGLLASDHRQTLDFFIVGLSDVSEPSVDRQELLYNASVLAHYAQVSTQSHGEVPAPESLGTVFDHFVLDTTLRLDGPMMETAGAQCLLLAGFFEEQMRRRHSIRCYAQLGSMFFTRAACRSREWSVSEASQVRPPPLPVPRGLLSPCSGAGPEVNTSSRRGRRGHDSDVHSDLKRRLPLRAIAAIQRNSTHSTRALSSSAP